MNSWDAFPWFGLAFVLLGNSTRSAVDSSSLGILIAKLMKNIDSKVFEG